MVTCWTRGPAVRSRRPRNLANLATLSAVARRSPPAHGALPLICSAARSPGTRTCGPAIPCESHRVRGTSRPALRRYWGTPLDTRSVPRVAHDWTDKRLMRHRHLVGVARAREPGPLASRTVRTPTDGAGTEPTAHVWNEHGARGELGVAGPRASDADGAVDGPSAAGDQQHAARTYDGKVTCTGMDGRATLVVQSTGRTVDALAWFGALEEGGVAPKGTSRRALIARSRRRLGANAQHPVRRLGMPRCVGILCPICAVAEHPRCRTGIQSSVAGGSGATRSARCPGSRERARRSNDPGATTARRRNTSGAPAARSPTLAWVRTHLPFLRYVRAGGRATPPAPASAGDASPVLAHAA